MTGAIGRHSVWFPTLLIMRDTTIFVTGILDMPESFEAGVDFEKKEKWQRAKPYLPCPVCQVVVHDFISTQVKEHYVADYPEGVSTLEDVAVKPKDTPKRPSLSEIDDEAVSEDRIYDYLDVICRNEELWGRYLVQDTKSPKKGTPKFELVQRTKWNDPAIAEADDLAKQKYDAEGYKLPAGQGHKFWQAHAMKEVCLEGVKGNDDDLKDILTDWWRQYLDNLADSDSSAASASRTSSSGLAIDHDHDSSSSSKSRKQAAKRRKKLMPRGRTALSKKNYPVSMVAMQTCVAMKQCTGDAPSVAQMTYKLFHPKAAEEGRPTEDAELDSLDDEM
ncbi:unnamed protein product [Amoebophrya sp. A25]|nr:unnamed protein product [Amoebophrya sp. A25]|eukprot:GSA25T00018644001.1